MDPPDVLGIDSGISRPTKLPNRAKSKLLQKFKHICLCTVFVNDHVENWAHSFSLSEQPPPRPPQPAVLLKSKFISSYPVLSKVCSPAFKNNAIVISWLWCLHVCPEPFYDSVMDDDEDDDDLSASSGLKRLGVSLGLKLRPWEGSGMRTAKSEVSLIDFTDDSFSSTTPSPLTETRQPDEDTLKVQLREWK